MRGGECQIDGGDSLTGGGGAELDGHPTTSCFPRMEAKFTVLGGAPSSRGPAVLRRRGLAPRAKFGASLRTFCVSRGIVLNRRLPGFVRADFEGLRGAWSFEIAREFGLGDWLLPSPTGRAISRSFNRNDGG